MLGELDEFLPETVLDKLTVTKKLSKEKKINKVCTIGFSMLSQSVSSEGVRSKFSLAHCKRCYKQAFSSWAVASNLVRLYCRRNLRRKFLIYYHVLNRKRKIY